MKTKIKAYSLQYYAWVYKIKPSQAPMAELVKSLEGGLGGMFTEMLNNEKD